MLLILAKLIRSLDLSLDPRNIFSTPNLFNLLRTPWLFAPDIIATLYPFSVASFTAIPSLVLKHLDSFPFESTIIPVNLKTLEI